MEPITTNEPQSWLQRCVKLAGHNCGTQPSPRSLKKLNLFNLVRHTGKGQCHVARSNLDWDVGTQQFRPRSTRVFAVLALSIRRVALLQ
ncbi:MAG TPA: hypothetical protein VKC66_37790 [Xanthobacteraceae bacterium]|nr:hypothetical protein [Xanthobacteraceae bacterium]